MLMHKDVEEVLLSQKQIVDKCEELGKKISKDYEGKTPVLIGLLKGAIPFYAEIVKHIECPMEMDFLDVSSYSGVNSTGKVVIKRDVTTNLKGRHVLFVEDIIDTGLTLSEVIKEFKKREIASYEVVTLVDKPEGRIVNDVAPKYIGFNIPNKFVVGFGLDYNELYRNLPYIGVLKKEVYSSEK